MLEARDGIGRMRLSRDWSLRACGWKILFVNDPAHWHAETFKEVPEGRVLLKHDDAHQAQVLNELSVLTRDLRLRGLVEVPLAYRPCGSHLVEATIARLF